MSVKRSRANFESDNSPSKDPPFVFYGTALPPLDSQTRDDGTYVPLWQQEVRDERGRKRLHGAFTGGFSAGYFNTVGSKEGWTPSTFVSSRSSRAKDGQQKKAEDFMDEEDLADMEESRQIQTQGTFAGFGGTNDGIARKGFMTDLFRTSGDTMGVKLLQRMGWRQGQGIGPKVRRKARDESDRQSTNTETYLFAPDDSPMIRFHRKTDRFGLGFQRSESLGGSDTKSKFAGGGETSYESDETKDDQDFFTPKAKLQVKNKSKKSSFGVGVLNDNGSDDEDAYSMGPKIAYNRIIGGDKRKKKGGLVANSSVQVPKKSFGFSSHGGSGTARGSGFRRCHDGKLPLDGFILASVPLVQDQENKHPPPEVPEGWKPSRVSDGAPAGTDSANFKSTADAARESTMDPSKRAAMLGETALPGKSIFDFISPEARNKLAAASGRANLPQGKGESAPAGYEPSAASRHKSQWDLVPALSREIAQAALTRGTSGWMPYAENEPKRSRYRAFLESMTGQRQELPQRAEGASTDDWVNEMREFAQAAQVFKPVTGLMASRFTSSKQEGPKVASDRPESNTDQASSGEKKQDPAEQAALLGMFGHMTRSRIDFYPTRLTCKRFGVKPPAHVVTDPGAQPGNDEERGPEAEKAGSERDSRLDVVGKNAMDAMMREAETNRRNAARDQSTAETTQQAPVKTEEVVDVEKNDALEGQRAGEELFAAIFGDDDEDS